MNLKSHLLFSGSLNWLKTAGAAGLKQNNQKHLKHKKQLQIYATKRTKSYKLDIICFSMIRKVKLMPAIFAVFMMVLLKYFNHHLCENTSIPLFQNSYLNHSWFLTPHITSEASLTVTVCFMLLTNIPSLNIHSLSCCPTLSHLTDATVVRSDALLTTSDSLSLP